ncbi:MAG TPA: hypothetical protein VD794_16025 [Flavisolibacter sp.]|nr:hypothetical protein [Flavisolibacter sp.]
MAEEVKKNENPGSKTNEGVQSNLPLQDKAPLSSNEAIAANASTDVSSQSTQPVQTPATASSAPVSEATQQQGGLLAKYGPNYVTAKNAQGETVYYTAKTWELLGDQRNDLKRVVETPQEVKDLQK